MIRLLSLNALLLLFFAMVQSGCVAQDSALIRKYQTQLRLIDSVRSFISKDLKLHVLSTYYTAWNDAAEDSMYIYLYVSKAEKVEADSAFGTMKLYSKEVSALSMSRAMQAGGYQTMLYRTAGNSNTRLSRKLLSYAPEAMAFILFHEVVHQNIGIAGGIPYNFEEALCDVVANSACVRFAEKTKMVDVDKAEKQRDIFETAYAYLNRRRSTLDTIRQESKPALYKSCTNTIYKMTADANQFQKDRLNYEVNNAYFLRIDDYARNYFQVKRIYSYHFDFKETIERIHDLKKK